MKRKCKNICEWVKTRWKWYVLGYYHCDQCPYSWEERGYEDCDCGCYIRGEIYDTCRLIEPFRTLIGWPQIRITQYWRDHQYDGFGEYWEEVIQRELAFEEAIEILLKNRYVCLKNQKGELVPLSEEHKGHIRNAFRGSAFNEALDHYEEKAHPFKPTPKLKTRWKELIQETWKICVFDKIAPFLPQKRRM